MSRIKSLDVLKGVGIIAVICLHAIQPGDMAATSLVWQVFNQVCRFAVPCFFLIGGFFFMHAWRQTSEPEKLICHYAARLMKPFLFWTLFYAIVPPFIGGAPDAISLKIREHLEALIRYPHTFFLTGFVYHLWFLSSLLQAAVVVWVCLRFGNLRIALVLGAVCYCLALAGGGVHANDIWIFHQF